MKNTFSLLALIFLGACNQSQQTESLQKQVNTATNNEITGLWRGVLQSPGGELPFGIEIARTNGVYSAKILNGKERVDTSAVIFENNKLIINFAWFDAKIEAKLTDENILIGQWSKTASGKDKTSSLLFTASRHYEYRFKQEITETATTSVAGNWQVSFSDEDGDSLAVAEFTQVGKIVNGTFLTPTGDYRFLSGVANNGKLFLSAFDGAHAFLFNAEIQDDKVVNGNFWSRDSYHAKWTAIKSNNTAEFLPSSWEMNKTTSDVAFAFEDTNGNLVQLTDERFRDKPVLVNIFGTWCPNCNDEAPVLAKFYDKYNSQGIEMVGLAFEFTENPERDKKQIEIFKQRHNINYPLLLAGGNDKSQATKVLGFLDEVKSYPTTVFLDKNHQVVKVHTGFSGPGTGKHYTQLVEELEAQIIELLN